MTKEDYSPMRSEHYSLAIEATFEGQMVRSLSHDPRVVLLDDEIHVASQCAEFLSTSGVATIVARSADEIEELLRIHASVFIVIVDLKMPGINGIEVARSIRHRFPERPLRFVLMSGLATPAERADADTAGIHTFIQKPTKARDVLLEVQSVLRELNLD
jgi:DNA-binding response OmpR family regulator